MSSSNSSSTSPQEWFMTYRPASVAAAYMRATGGRMNASHSGRPMMRPRCWPQSSPNQTASTP